MKRMIMAPIRLRARNHTVKPVSWLELFFDLIFVAAVGQVAVPLAHDYSFAGLVRFAFLFLLIWMAWLGHTMFNTRFLSDDPLQRLLTLVQIFAIAIMAANAKEALSSRDAAGFAAAYAVMRIVLVLQYLRARAVTEARRLVSTQALGLGVAAAFWLSAAFLDAPMRFWVWGCALSIEFITPTIAYRITHAVPPDPSHLPERFGLFTIILIGESVMATMRGIESQEGWSVQAASSAFFGLCLTFAFWCWYFDHSGATEDRHVRSRKDESRFQVWCYSHFALYLSIVVAGIGVEHAISLPDGEFMGVRAATLLVSSLGALMMSMIVISQASVPSPSPAYQMRAIASLALLAPILWCARALSPAVLLACLVSVTVLQIFIARKSSAKAAATFTRTEFEFAQD